MFKLFFLTNMHVINYDAGISLLHCGVLRKMERNLIKKKHVFVKEEHVGMMFDRRTKRRFKGFVHAIPG